MKTFFALLILTVCFASCKKDLVQTSDEPVSVTSSDEANITSNDSIKNQTPVSANISTRIKGFLLHLPDNYTTTKQKFPLLISISGDGQFGNGSTDLYKITFGGVPTVIQTGRFPQTFKVNSKSYRYIVVAPQFTTYPYSADVNAMINYAINHYRIDVTRIYMTGFSMGGGVTVNFCDTLATKLAAVVPMANCQAPYPSVVQKIVNANLPLWAFHNKYDTNKKCPPSNSIDLVNQINAYSPAIPAKITLFNSSTHNCWTAATKPSYKENNMNIYQWMLQYQRL